MGNNKRTLVRQCLAAALAALVSTSSSGCPCPCSVSLSFLSSPFPSYSQRQSCGKCSVKSATSSQSAHKIVSFVLLSPSFASPASPRLALVWHWRWLRNQLQSFELLLLPSCERAAASVVIYGQHTRYAVAASIYSLAALTSTRTNIQPMCQIGPCNNTRLNWADLITLFLW